MLKTGQPENVTPKGSLFEDDPTQSTIVKPDADAAADEGDDEDQDDEDLASVRPPFSDGAP